MQPDVSKCGASNELLMKDVAAFTPAYNGRPTSLIGSITDRPAKQLIDGRKVLYIEDETGAIPCFVEASISKPSLLQNGPVLVRNWNPIYNKSGNVKHIEVMSPVIPISQSDCNPSVQAITVRDAVFVQCKRDLLGKRAINVCGKLHSVSEINRVKNDKVFLATLTNENDNHFIDILVKVDEFVHWQWVLQPGQVYVFGELRPTTLFKGTAKQTQVFTTTSQSVVHHADDAVVEYQKAQDIITVPDEDGLESLQLSDNIVEDQLINYQGTISKILDLSCQIFELDGRIRLCLAFCSPDSGYSHLRPNTSIIAHNVHQVTLGSRPTLYGCHKSSVKVQNFPRSPQGNHTDTGIFLPAPLPSTTYLLECQLAARRMLLEKFNKDFISRHKRGMQVMLEELITPEETTPTRAARSFTTEYFQHRTVRCPITEKSVVSACQLVTIDEVLSWAKQESEKQLHSGVDSLKNIPLNNSSTSSVYDLNNKLYWRCLMKTNREKPCDQWILLGMLNLDKTTGNILLEDKTGQIYCILAPTSNNLEELKTPTAIQQPENGASEHFPPHPFMCSDLTEKFVEIRNFAVVIETFTVSNYPSERFIGDDKYIESVHHRIYLMLSASDICIKSSTTYGANRVPVKNIDPYMKVNNMEITNDEGHSSLGTSVKVCDGKPSAQNSKIRDESSKVSDEADMQSFIVQCASQLVCFCQKFYVIWKECPRVRRRFKPDVTLGFYAEVQFMGDLYIKETTYSAGACQHGMTSNYDPQSPEGIKVVLFFSGVNVKWYSLLHPGSCYCLSRWGNKNMRKDAIFLGAELPTNTRRAVLKTKASVCVTIDDTMGIVLDTLLIPDLSVTAAMVRDGKLDTTDAPHSVSQCLSDGYAGPSVLNLHAVVDSRRFENIHSESGTSNAFKAKLAQENLSLGVCSQTSAVLVLCLCDVNTRDSINLYLPCGDISYPIGLVHGTLVLFTKLERKVGTKSQRPYLSYSTASCHWIYQQPSWDENQEFIKKWDHTANKGQVTSIRLLQKVWFENLAEIKGSFSIICFVQNIIKLMISAVCGVCGSLWKDGRCRSERCGKQDEPILQTKANLLVEDGTATAMVFCNTPSTVRSLLTLSSSQWQALENLIITHGSVEYQQKSGMFGGDVHLQFIQHLVSSSLVRKSLTMNVKPFKNFYVPGSSNKHATIHSLKLQDFPIQQIDLGQTSSTIHTRALPWLQFECLHIKETDLVDLQGLDLQ